MAPFGSARSELLGGGAAAAAERCCSEAVDRPAFDTARCRELSEALRDSLGGGAAALDEGSAATWAQLVRAEADREAAIKRKDYAGQQAARDTCDALRAALAARAAER